ncbi:MAG: hypothetical protein JNG84_00235 [Archangium sp.]|nr:hypothetical protein [Archangium sp.]
MMSRVCFGCLVVWCSGAFAEDSLEVRLARGDVIVSTEPVAGSDIPRVTVQGVIDAPPEKMWTIIDDCGNYAKHMPRIAASTEVSRDGNKVTCRITADMPWPVSDLTSESAGVHTVEPGKRWMREWKLVRGDYVQNTGRWVLTPFGTDATRTLAMYQVHVQPKVALPQALLNSAQTKTLPTVIYRLREVMKAK